jgi:hypothetical protein
MSELMQEAAMATGTDEASETPVCRCGAGSHPTHAGHCLRGHATPGNQLHRTHGAYSFRDRGDAAISDDLRISADDLLAGVLADKGGAENCPTLLREYIRQTRNLRVVLDLLNRDMVENGLFTQKRRVRSTFSKWLETLDRFDRFATKIGLEREARQVPSLSAYLAQARATDEETQP